MPVRGIPQTCPKQQNPADLDPCRWPFPKMGAKPARHITCYFKLWTTRTIEKHMSASGKGGQAGFTLMEATIASMILILALVSVLALGARGFRYLEDMRQWARSSQVLQQKMEDIRLITVWTNVWALDNTTFRDSTITGETYKG